MPMPGVAELSSYSLSDFVLFSAETYFRQYELHNQALWPIQIATLALGLAALYLTARRRGGRVLALAFAGCWLWVAWAFHFQRYAEINWAATWFGWVFVAQAGLLVVSGHIARRLQPISRPEPARRVGLALVVIAVIAYPVLAPLGGRPWTAAEVFGIAPDPTAIATLGLVVSAGHRVSWELLIIPLLWCLLSGLLGVAMGTPALLIPPTLAAAALASALYRTLRG